MSAKTYVVTGATSGIGQAAVEQLVAAGHNVIMAARNPEKAESQMQSLGTQRVSYLQVDLASMQSIRDFCDALADKVSHVDGLLNNAGLFPRKRVVTEEGIEQTWAVNVLAYFAMTQWTLPLLKAAPGGARVVDVASSMVGEYDADDVQFSRRKFKSIAAYKQSKQCNRMLAWVWAEKLAGSSVTINVVHPGMVATNIQNNQVFPIRQIMKFWWKWKGISPQEGADTPVWALTDESLAVVSGKMFARRKERDRKFSDQQANQALWSLCEDMISDALAGGRSPASESR